MIDNKNTTDQHKKNLKRFGIISSVIFAVIVLFSIIWIYSSGNSKNVVISSINILILSSGIIGLSYGIMMLRTIDKKIDDNIIKHYEKLLEDINNNSQDK